jgi:two-component system, OmpR family, sensor histidine kinase KdpD
VRDPLTFQIRGYLTGLATIIVVTMIYDHEVELVKTTTIVLTYLLAILIASTVWGLGVSVFMSVMSALCVDYFFLPPLGTLNINDTQDWVTLFSFLVTAVIGSELSARATRQAQEANRQRNEIRQLYEFSQRLLNARNALALFDEIPLQIVEVFRLHSALLYLAGKQSFFRSGKDPEKLGDSRVIATCERGEMEEDAERGVSFCPVRLGAQTIGSFGVSGSMLSKHTLEAIATLIAAAIDRMQAIELLSKNEAARESERLKSVLLDAIAHDFKTPLTSIKAAATSLLEDLEFNKQQRGELLYVIDEECDRINRVIGQAIEMAQLDAGAVKLQPAPHFVSELITAALEDCESVQHSRQIKTEVQEKDAQVHCDLFWARKVLGHLIRNADLYSSPREPITIRTERKNNFILFHVVDVGPGIEKAELSQIFEKFFRGKNQRHRVPGTGMGLSVARAIVDAHGGKFEVTSEVGRGSIFTFSLPMEPVPTNNVP